MQDDNEESEPRRITTSIGAEPYTIAPTKPESQVTAGDSESIYTVTVRNEGAPRHISLRLVADDRAAPLLKRTYQFDADTHLRMEIGTPGQYTVELSIEERDGASTRTTTTMTGFTVADCQRGKTRITISDTGVETSSRSVCRS